MADQLDQSYSGDFGQNSVKHLTPTTVGIPSNLPSKSSFDGGVLGTIGSGFPGVDMSPADLDNTQFGGSYLAGDNPSQGAYGPVEMNDPLDSQSNLNGLLK